MVYNSYGKVRRSEFYNKVSANDRVHDISQNQLKLKVNNTYKKYEKKQQNLKPLMKKIS